MQIIKKDENNIGIEILIRIKNLMTYYVYFELKGYFKESLYFITFYFKYKFEYF